jgi:hypothetical protein
MDQEWQFIWSVTLSEGLNIENLGDSAILVYWCHILALKSATGAVLFPNVSKLMQCQFLLPISNVIAERLFCFLEEVKTDK